MNWFGQKSHPSHKHMVEINKISFSVFDVLNKILTFQMKDCNYESVMESYIPYWIILQQDVQNLFNYFLHLLVKGSKIYIHTSFINISKHSFCFKTYEHRTRLYDGSSCGRAIMYALKEWKLKKKWVQYWSINYNFDSLQLEFWFLLCQSKV